MSESDDTMARLDRLEGAIVKISELLVLQNQRIEQGFIRVDDEMRSTREALTSRLDRLIAVTIEERTLSAARLLDFDRRLSKIEERLGV